MRSCSLRNRKVQGPNFILVLITPRRQPALIHFDRCGSTVPSLNRERQTVNISSIVPTIGFPLACSPWHFLTHFESFEILRFSRF